LTKRRRSQADPPARAVNTSLATASALRLWLSVLAIVWSVIGLWLATAGQQANGMPASVVTTSSSELTHAYNAAVEITVARPPAWLSVVDAGPGTRRDGGADVVLGHTPEGLADVGGPGAMLVERPPMVGGTLFRFGAGPETTEDLAAQA
jgi:hypothetical protein